MMKIALLMLIPLMSMGQYNCSPYHNTKSVRGDEQIQLTGSFAFCFHYNAATFGMQYDGFFLDAVLMNRTKRMAMMPGEQYGIVGYGKTIHGGFGITNNGTVGLIGYKKTMLKNMFITGRLYQTTQPMRHIAVGLGFQI
jgi:hypothetical protein